MSKLERDKSAVSVPILKLKRDYSAVYVSVLKLKRDESTVFAPSLYRKEINRPFYVSFKIGKS